MDFFRNPEIRISFFIYILIDITISVMAFFINQSCGAIVALVCIAYTIIHFVSTAKRYKKIFLLSCEIDGILHGKESLNLNEYAEGELAILQSEILKLTIQLREQASQLKNDKLYLADSIADISHQIRTPLTSINIITSMMSKHDLPDEKRLELVKQLEILLSRIDWLISSLLKMSKLDAGTAEIKSENVSVSELISRATAPIAIPMELREQQMIVTMKGDEHFTGDLKWSVEAIENILKNCMEHTPVGGQIEVIACENVIYTEIIIRDNGSGIDKEDLPHLFERFYKGKNSSEQSVGIGLALARMIVSNQNGTIKAENRREGGAIFTIRFYKGAV